MSDFISFNKKKRSSARLESKRGKLYYRGTPIAIYEDYAPEVLEQRSKYKEVLSELYKLGQKTKAVVPGQANYIAKEGNRRRITSVPEAKDYIASLRSAED